MLRIQLLEHTFVPDMEILIPELFSLSRHICHRYGILCAWHKLFEHTYAPGI